MNKGESSQSVAYSLQSKAASEELFITICSFSIYHSGFLPLLQSHIHSIITFCQFHFFFFSLESLFPLAHAIIISCLDSYSTGQPGQIFLKYSEEYVTLLLRILFWLPTALGRKFKLLNKAALVWVFQRADYEPWVGMEVAYLGDDPRGESEESRRVRSTEKQSPYRVAFELLALGDLGAQSPGDHLKVPVVSFSELSSQIGLDIYLLTAFPLVGGLSLEVPHPLDFSLFLRESLEAESILGQGKQPLLQDLSGLPRWR